MNVRPFDICVSDIDYATHLSSEKEAVNNQETSMCHIDKYYHPILLIPLLINFDAYTFH